MSGPEAPEFRLGPFALDQPLARGATGQVWRARSPTGEVVAIKLYHVAAARQERFQAAFRNEVRAAAALDHPGVVGLIDHALVPEDDAADLPPSAVPGTPYLVMELAEGGSLDAGGRARRWEEIRPLLLGVLDALGHAHARGVLHRDVKPANVVLDEAGRPLLTDFGLAWALDRDGAEAGSSPGAGTPAYMAPEQFSADTRAFGPWTDLYGVGCLAWELSTGAPPFRRADAMALVAAHLLAPVPPLRPRTPVPRGFEEVLRGLLEKDPSRRFAFAADVAHALRRLPLPGSESAWAPVRPPFEADPGIASPDSGEPTLGTTVETPPADDRPRAPPRSPDPGGSATAYRPFGTPPFPSDWRAEGGGGARPVPAGAGLGLYGLRPVPLVGREAERDALWEALGRVATTSEAEAVVLDGPAGCGKSRLAEWLCERAQELGVAVAMRASHGSAISPSHGVGAMVARHHRVSGLPRPALARSLEASLRRLGGSDPQEWEALAELVAPAGAGEGAPAVRFAGAAERHETLARWLGRVARDRPAVVWIDDAPWGADSVEAALHLLARRGRRPLRALIVLTARTEDLPLRPVEAASLRRLLERPGARALPIGPLPDRYRSALVQGLLGLQGSLADRVEVRTGGNPLFAVQLVGDWVRRGLLVPGLRGFELRPGARVDLPDDLHGVWSARVEAALAGRGDDEVRALEVAAALGPEVDGDEWRAVCDRAGARASAGLVEALLDHRLARCGAEGPAASWTLVHPLLKESLGRRAREAGRWAAVHRACAEVLGARRGARTAERLGRHLLLAGEPEAAIGPLAAGVRELLTRGEFAAARDALDAWQDAAAAAPLGDSDPRWADGWLLRAWVHKARGEYDEMAPLCRRVEEAAVRFGWERAAARVRRDLGLLAMVRGDLAGAESTLSAAEEASRALGDVENVAACCLNLGDAASRRGGHTESDAWLVRGREAYAEVGDEKGVASCVLTLARNAQAVGDLDRAEALLGEARGGFERCGARWGVAIALSELGALLRTRGDFGRALTALDEALARREAIGMGGSEWDKLEQAMVRCQTGRFAEARRILELDLNAALGGHSAFLRLGILAALLPCLAARGDVAAFDTRFGELERGERDTGGAAAAWAEMAILAGDLWSEAGDPDRAAAAWRLALRVSDTLGSRDGVASVRRRMSD